MTFELFCFFVFAGIAALAALGVVTLKNTVHSVLLLVLTFFSTACTWILAQAEFLGVALVVVYVGAVMVLFLFVVMMLDIDQEKMREGFAKYLPVGIVVAAVMLVEMLAIVGVRSMHAATMGPDPAQALAQGNTEWLGMALFSTYLLPFEIAAVILTVGLIAAVTLTLRTRSGVKKQYPSEQVAVDPKQRVRVVKMAASRPEGEGA
ncbi:MAG TPA: NADH-quinone oxidoreductase subunit J [Rhodanobacteraceae bacterium]|nr:NADH-quinone oxidoreductase subunit J [Rhodanobacteraceae bacterium]